MNEPGDRSRGLGNVFKGGGGISRGLIDRLRDDRGPNLRGVGLVRGHFPLGIRDYLSNCLPRSRELRCFTFLREPADRTLSHYFRIRESATPYGLPPLPADATIEDALERGYIHDNLHTRMLSGQVEPFGTVDEEMLEQAKRNLREELVFFGLTERFDESLVLAKRRLGFRSILYKTSGRVNTARARGEEVPDELLETAREYNRYDIELYRYAQELFDAAPERSELDFEVELAALRVAKADGELDAEVPMPDRYGGDEQAWRMLLEARTEAQHLEWELAEAGVRAAAARRTMREVKEQMERMESAPERLNELEQEVERLQAAADGEAGRESGSRRSQNGRGRTKRTARQPAKRGGAGPKRAARQSASNRSRPRPKRDSRRVSSKRGAQSGARPRASGRRRGADSAPGGEDG